MDIWWHECKTYIYKGARPFGTDSSCQVALVSPLVFTLLIDLTKLARNTSYDELDFMNYQIENSSKELQNLYYNICKE